MRLLLFIGAMLVTIGIWIVIDGRDVWKHQERKLNVVKGILVGIGLSVVGMAMVFSYFQLHA